MPPEPGLPVLGSVAPDAPLPEGGRLRDRLGRGFVFVVPHALPTGRLAEVVEVRGGSAYGDGRAWLIRPDGHLSASLPLGEATPSALDALVAKSVA